LNRRVLIGALAGGLLGGPRLLEAQQAARVYRIGILANVPLTAPGGAVVWGAFVQGLRDLGYEPGRNIVLELRSSDGHYDRLPTLATELVRLNVDVIVAPAPQNVAAAKRASPTIPIVMAAVGDPVGEGLVASLARPGGNVTGTSFVTSVLVGKQLELLREIVPNAARLAVLVNPANSGHPLLLDAARAAARSMGAQLQTVNARGPADLAAAFKSMTAERAGACFVPWDGTFLVHLVQITRLAASSRLPALYGHRGYVDAGRTRLLWGLRPREQSEGRRLRRQDSQGRETGRSSNRAAHQVRVRHQPEGREGPRRDDSAVATRASGSGDRVTGRPAEIAH